MDNVYNACKIKSMMNFHKFVYANLELLSQIRENV
jgi:hypothetical protein